MIRKRILTSLIVLCATVASPIVLASYSMPGKVIMGMDVGYSSRSGNLNSDYRTTTNLIGPFAAVAPGAPLASVVEKISDSGTTLGILGGYQLDLAQFFVGLEGHVDFGRYENVKMHHFTTTNATVIAAAGGTPTQFISEATYIQGTTYGLTVRAGMTVPLFGNFHIDPYLRVGGEYADHELSITNVFTATPPPLPFDHYTHKKGKWRALVGAGFEVPLFSDVVGMRFEYNYMPGPDIEFNDNIDTLGASHSFKPKTHTGKLAIVINLG